MAIRCDWKTQWKWYNVARLDSTKHDLLDLLQCFFIWQDKDTQQPWLQKYIKNPSLFNMSVGNYHILFIQSTAQLHFLLFFLQEGPNIEGAVCTMWSKSHTNHWVLLAMWEDCCTMWKIWLSPSFADPYTSLLMICWSCFMLLDCGFLW